MAFNTHVIIVAKSMPSDFTGSLRAGPDIGNDAFFMRVMASRAGNRTFLAQRQDDVVLIFHLFDSG